VKRRTLTVTALLAAMLVRPGPASAGGALSYDTAGSPVGWSTASPVAYHTDLGGLGTLTEAAATTLVDDLFEVWEAVPTATITYAHAGTLGVDVDETNFVPYLGPYGGATLPRGETAIVFDADGAIFDALFGVGTGVLGFAGPTFFDDGFTLYTLGDPLPPGAKIIEGLAFLNGRFLDGIDDPGSGNYEIDLETFEAVFVHELGHLSGLDHTQIHGLDPASGAGFTSPVETMFPYLLTAEQSSPELDDTVALSRLYPTPAFTANTGCLSGRVLTADGQPFSGANVIALEPDGHPWPPPGISEVSGADGVNVGAYRLCGLQPGVRYVVQVSEIDAFHTGGSSVGPLSPPLPLPGPSEFYGAPLEVSNPAADSPLQWSWFTAAPGDFATNVDVRLNAQRFLVRNLELPGTTSPVGMAPGDFDGDGSLDLVTVQDGFAPGSVRFLRGLGDGTFAPAVAIASFPGNVTVVAGHFDGDDAWLDFAVASRSLNEVRVYQGNGDGTFQSPSTPIPSPGVTIRPIVFGRARLDADAHDDLVYVELQPAGSVRAVSLLGDGDGGFTTVESSLLAGENVYLFMSALAAGPFDGSPGDDVVFHAGPIPPRLAILHGNGAGGFSGVIQSFEGVLNRSGDGLAGGDLDGDGDHDLAISDLSANIDSSAIELLRNDGTGLFTVSASYSVPEPFQPSILITDLDRDGRPDVASTGATADRGHPGASLHVAYGDGAGGTRPVLGALGPEPIQSTWGLAEFPALFTGGLVAGDFDGDGRTDLVTSGAQGGVFGVDHPPRLSMLLARDLPSQAARGLFTVTPCRLLDTRATAALQDGVVRSITVIGNCNVLEGAGAVAANVTVTGATGGGHLTFHAGGSGGFPLVSHLNFAAGQTRANNAVLELAPDGTGTVLVRASVLGAGQVHVIVDVVGYFE
jgi:hypothetical protein